MSAPCSNATPDDEIMALFARDLETADDPGTVIRDYCAGHPSLAEEIRALAAMMQKVDRSRPEPAVQQPTQLGEFRILRRIDHGGQGEIYEAVQERLHRRVAVKIIRRGRISPDARARFLREQQVLAQLHQTHIVPIYTADETDGLEPSAGELTATATRAPGGPAGSVRPVSQSPRQQPRRGGSGARHRPAGKKKRR